MALIAVFDSGVGGLSILRELIKKMPGHEYVFISDNAAFPYGTKQEAELISRVNLVMTRVIESIDPDIVVIACNTASTLVLPSLRQTYSIPFVGVVPAIKPAARITRSKTIGLLATPATVSRAYTADLISQFASDCEVITQGSSELVLLAEQKLAGEDIDKRQLFPILLPFIETPKCDVLVLACTHFPLLGDEIESVFEANDHSIILLDSGQAIARRVEELLQVESGTSQNAGGDVASRSLLTQAIDERGDLAKVLTKMGLPYQANW